MSAKPPVDLWPDPEFLGPVTDLYQLTMMAGYVAAGKGRDRATFELFVRRLPEHRAFLVFAGLEQALADVLRLAFSAEQVDAIRRWPIFAETEPAFFDGLVDFRFRGNIWAVPEGTIVFPGEPLLRVEADLPQAQWLETFLLASHSYPTLVASKAARIVEAASGRPVYDFGARRGHGPHAGFLAARAAFLAGFAGTSHVEAARRLQIPCVGTMAHSWVQSFSTEAEAFETFARLYPDAATLLVDTYDTEVGDYDAAAIEPPIQAVRIDSGDLGELSREARAYFDEHARRGVKIFASGDLDETSIQRLVSSGAPIDSFGVGTELATSRDAPALALVYKLVEINGAGRLKLSAGKKTYPMAKQIYRRRGGDGRFAGDMVVRADESSDGEPLLVRYVEEGRLIRPLPGLDEIAERCREQLAALPDELRRLDAGPSYPIIYSPLLEREASRIAADLEHPTAG